jgi:hypothetical protein
MLSLQLKNIPICKNDYTDHVLNEKQWRNGLVITGHTYCTELSLFFCVEINYCTMSNYKYWLAER